MTKEKLAVSIFDVARAAGVSIASVSRALNAGSGSVSEKTRLQVMLAAEQLNYSPNQIGRSLRVQNSNTYAFMLSNIQNNLFSAVAWELERRLSNQGSGMLLYTTNEDPITQDRCIDDALSRQVGGIFFLCAVDSTKLSEASKRVRCVFINRRIPEVAASLSPFVGIDDYNAARDLMRTCLKRTSKRILVLHGPSRSDTSARRLKGFVDAAAEAGSVIPADDLCEAELSMDSGYKLATQKINNGQYGAVVCGNDQIAYGVWRRCRELGIEVPSEMQLYGFDDNPLNEWLAPWLSTIRVPHKDFAAAAEKAMSEVDIETIGETILPYDLLLRV
jgi:LacI family transcriptional regulator